MSEICVNKIISDCESGSQYIVLWIAPDNEYGYWYDLSSNSRLPKSFRTQDIVGNTTDERYEFESFTSPCILRPENSLTDKERKQRDHIWGILQHVVESEPDIYDKKKRAALLKEISGDAKFSNSYLYRLIDRYWRSGKTKNAFIPEYSNCGARGKARTNAKQKLGRQTAESGTTGKVLTDTDRNNFSATIKRYYLNQNKISFKFVYEKLLQDYYTLKTKNRKLKLMLPNEIPTLRQFQYWYYKNRDIVNEKKKRNGEKTFELESRAVLGKSDYGLLGPGAQYQVDATVGDIYLVSQFDPTNLIGRPVLYFVIDAFSRMITGMSVALEGPSWASAMTAIANMAADKVAYCKEYDIEITEDEWPCRHVPAVMRGDRGEMESKNADSLVNMLGIRVENTPPYRADWKGIIEQHFRTINTNSIALLPGSVKPDMSRRGGRDYRLDAALNIREFTQIIIKCVLFYNNHHYMDYLEKSEAMMRDKVDSIPCRIWEWGVRHFGALRYFPEEMVRLAVLPTDKASVTEKGIKFRNLFYSSDRAVREAWFEKARAKKPWQVPVSYDTRNMANLYIWNQDDKKYDACYLLEWNQKYAGKYLDEIIYEQKKEAIDKKRLKLSEIEAKVNLNAEIDTIVSEAKSISKGFPEKSNRERVSNITENRRNERDIMRLNTSMISDDVENMAEATSASQTKRTEEDLDPITQMIKKKVEERRKK